MSTNQDQALREHLLEVLTGASAHADFATVIDHFPEKHYGTKPPGTPYSAWQLLKHIRIALYDLLDFSVNPDYVTLKFPDDYWPEQAAPASTAEWHASVKAVKEDLAKFEKLINDPALDLYAKIPWGDGQTVLREVLVAADHNSYHMGQIVLLRKQLDAWQEK